LKIKNRGVAKSNSFAALLFFAAKKIKEFAIFLPEDILK
jgi:hypothetical protein